MKTYMKKPMKGIHPPTPKSAASGENAGRQRKKMYAPSPTKKKKHNPY